MALPRARPGTRRRLLLAVAVPALLPACVSGGGSGVATVSFPGDLPSVVDAVLAAAPGCGLRLLDARRDETSGTAFLVFLDGWQDPRPESALLTVRFDRAPGGISSRLEARPFAEYGLQAPDLRAGSEGLVCKPCSDRREEIPMVRYSRGEAMASGSRVTRCLREGLEAVTPPAEARETDRTDAAHPRRP